MVYYRHPGGGIVFSVGSLTFTGNLADDPTVQRIVANVLDDAAIPRWALASEVAARRIRF